MFSMLCMTFSLALRVVSQRARNTGERTPM